MTLPDQHFIKVWSGQEKNTLTAFTALISLSANKTSAVLNASASHSLWILQLLDLTNISLVKCDHVASFAYRKVMMADSVRTCSRAPVSWSLRGQREASPELPVARSEPERCFYSAAQSARPMLSVQRSRTHVQFAQRICTCVTYKASQTWLQFLRDFTETGANHSVQQEKDETLLFSL